MLWVVKVDDTANIILPCYDTRRVLQVRNYMPVPLSSWVVHIHI